ncbi:hypothetical protein K1719_035498 [Acacia pycnantha]|nr:hypothetical protein K1719_035498 [Acacia pycnantha]
MLQKALLFAFIFGLSSFAFIQSQEYQPSYLTPTSSVLKYHGGPLLTDQVVSMFISYGDIYSLGKSIKRAQIATLIKNKIWSKIFPLDSNGIYLVLTAKDVSVERFCMGLCGFHDSIWVSWKTRVVYGHVRDSLDQCPGYFQGDALAPIEAVTACSGIFGVGSYPGYPASPARLLVDDTAIAFKICADEAIELWLKWVHGSLHFLEGKECEEFREYTAGTAESRPEAWKLGFSFPR